MLSSIIVLALAVTAQAAPTNNVRSTNAFSAPAVHKGIVRNGTASLLKAYAKYNLKPTMDLPAAFMNDLGKRQDSSTTAVPSQGDNEYLVEVSVGGQTLNLDFDSGSSDLWVFSSELPSSQRSGHSIYTPAKSKTFQNLQGYTWDISYADGSGASGNVGLDTVIIGSTTVQQQAIELAQKVSSAFVSDTSDGLVGLAFSNINTVQPKQQTTFFDNAQQSLNSPLFAAYLPANANGAYDFGETHASRFTGSIQYTNVDSSNGFWEYPSTSYKVGTKTYTQSGFTAISDTGTTLILMSDSAVSNYYASVSGAKFDNNQGGYVFPCSAKLPNLSLSIGGKFAVVKGSLLNFASAGGSSCFGGLQSVGGGNQAIFGDVFFNANYGVFDASGPRFGFAGLV